MPVGMQFMTASAPDHLMQELATGAQPIEGAGSMPAQGIQCGKLNLAFSYSWARSIVEDIELTPVPNSPDWLIGAANVEGEIMPVFDLASWFAADVPDDPNAEPSTGKKRLLVGGHAGDRAAILFSGPARTVRYAPGVLRVPGGPVAPPRLSAVVLAASEFTPTHWVIDMQRLFEQLAGELADSAATRSTR